MAPEKELTFSYLKGNMTRKLKVYVGNLDGLYEVVVATTSKKRVAALVNTTLHHVNEYFTDTGNEVQIKVALANPEVPYIRSYKLLGSRNTEDYKPLSDRYKK